MKEFIEDTIDRTFEERGELLVSGEQGIGETHEKMAQEGQTAVKFINNLFWNLSLKNSLNKLTSFTWNFRYLTNPTRYSIISLRSFTRTERCTNLVSA